MERYLSNRTVIHEEKENAGKKCKKSHEGRLYSGRKRSFRA